jgi:protein-tyrosine-phosphatase
LCTGSLQRRALERAAGFDWIITMCDSANERCPVFPGTVKRFHAGFDDPPKLAKDVASNEEALSHYRESVIPSADSLKQYREVYGKSKKALQDQACFTIVY